MKKVTTLILLAFCIFTQVYSQDYRQAVGIRLGASGGITYRRMLANDLGGEIMLNAQNQGTVITLLVEKHRPALLFDKYNLEFFYGAGTHFGIADRYKYDDDHSDPEEPYRKHSSVPQLGFDGYASLEYTLQRYPVVINLDCKPYLEFFDDHFLGLHLPVIAIGAKYVF